MLTLGADPEVFVTDTERGPYSASEFLKGSKADPEKVKYGALQYDGLAAEFNITPAKSEKEWVRNISTVMSILNQRITNYRGTSSILIRSTCNFSHEYFETLPLEVKLLGCEPDIDAYTLEEKQPPNTAMDTPLRSGGGHIHFGGILEYDGVETKALFARHLDSVLPVAEQLWDTDETRRTLYGTPGSFRDKDYGLEYRVLSNAWVRTEGIQRWIYRACKRAWEDFEEGFIYPPPKKMSTYQEIVQWLDQLGHENPQGVM